MNDVWIQIIITLGGIFGGLITYGKYLLTQTDKREERMIKMFEESQQNIIQLYSQKNAQNERITKDFSNTVREINKSILDSNRQTNILRENLTQVLTSLQRIIETNTSVTQRAAQTVAEEIKK